MISTKKKFHPSLLVESDLCKRLITTAGKAYIARYNQKINHEQYYISENHPDLTFRKVDRDNEIARYWLNHYLHLYIKLYKDTLNSRLTTPQLVCQAKSFFKTYSGVAGDQKAFKDYYGDSIRSLIRRHDTQPFHMEDALDSSDDDDENIPRQKFIQAAKHSIVKTSFFTSTSQPIKIPNNVIGMKTPHEVNNESPQSIDSLLYRLSETKERKHVHFAVDEALEDVIQLNHQCPLTSEILTPNINKR